MEQQDRKEVLEEAQKILESSKKLDETVEEVETLEKKKRSSHEKKKKQIDGLYTEACKQRNLDPKTMKSISPKKKKKEVDEAKEIKEVVDQGFFKETEPDLEEIEVQVNEKMEEKKKIPEKKLGYKRSKHVSGLDIVLIFIIVGLVLFIGSRVLGMQTDSISLPDAMTQRSVLAYINTSQPYAFENDILMQIGHAAYDEESEILVLDFTVTNNNDETIRFMSSSFEIVSEELTVTPILARSINETDETPASGIKKGETMEFSISYDLDPKDLAGRSITLKGLFLNKNGKIPMEVKIPELLQVR